MGTSVPVAQADNACPPDYALMGSEPQVGGVSQGGVYIRTQCGTVQTRLTNNPTGYPDAMPALSPDGSQVAFVRESQVAGGVGSDIWVVPTAGGAATQVTHINGIVEAPNWSPDGQNLVLENAGEIYVVGADGSGLRRVLEGRQPAWCGGVIVFMWQGHLYSMNPDGSGLLQISNGFWDSWPACSPDNQYVFYQQQPGPNQGNIDVIAITGGTPEVVVGAPSGYFVGKPAVAADWTLGYVDGVSGSLKLRWLGDTASVAAANMGLNYLDEPAFGKGDGWTPPPDGLQLPAGLPAPLPLLQPSPAPSASPTSPPVVLAADHPETASQKAVDWAIAQVGSVRSQELHRNWSGWCEAFVEIAYGTRHRYGSALEDYRAQNKAGQIHKDSNPPAGALVFYGGGRDGHVALSIGNGMVVTTWGYIGQRYPVREMKVHGFSNPYYGWAYAPTSWPGRQ